MSNIGAVAFKLRYTSTISILCMVNALKILRSPKLHLQAFFEWNSAVTIAELQFYYNLFFVSV